MNPNAQLHAAAVDPQALREAIREADVIPLLLSLVQITGDAGWLERVRLHVRGAWSFLQDVPDGLQAEIREALVAAILNAKEAGGTLENEPPEDLLARMLEVAAGQLVPEEYRAVFREETAFGGIDHRKVDWRRPPDEARLGRFKVGIIGAGFSGLAMAMKLEAAGIPYVVIEKNREVGGTWLENFYPGCGVDTPCHFYSYSFKPNTEWSSYFVKRDELLAYIQRSIEGSGVRDRIRFGEEVTSARFDERSSKWQLDIRGSDGSADTLVVDVLVTAVGALNRPAIPTIPGLSSFAGPCFHTAAWGADASLAGKRVAMIGTGASGMQVAPTIAPEVERLTIFQRSPHWIIRHPLYHADVSPGVRWAMKNVPFYASWFRFQLFWGASDGFHGTLRRDPDWPHPERSLNAANDKLRQDLIAYINSELGDRPDLLPKVIPDYPPFGKRMLRDNHWYKTLRRDNVELVTGAVERVEPDAVVVDGERYPADVIVLATGFQAARMLWPMEVTGRGGVTVRDLWGEDDPRAHLGMTVPGFPNFFMIYGPNTNLAHGGSAVFHSECQVAYIMQAIRELIETGSDTVEVRPEPFEDYNSRVDEAHRGMVWSHPGVTNWYKNKSGRVVMNSPWRLAEYRNMTAAFEPAEYVFTRHADGADATSSRETAA